MEDLSLFFLFFVQYFSRTKSIGGVRDRDIQVSPFQLINPAIMQQDQTLFFSPSPGPRFLGGHQKHKVYGWTPAAAGTPSPAPPQSGCSWVGCWGVSQAPCQLGSKRSSTVPFHGTVTQQVDPSVTECGSEDAAVGVEL